MKKIVLFALLTVVFVSALVIGTSAAAYNEEIDVAKIGTEGYATLADAVAAAKDGDTIYLTKPVDRGAGIVLDGTKTLTLDFGNNTYNVDGPSVGSHGTETLGFQIKKGADMTLKNGKITTTCPTVYLLIQNYTNLTLTNMVVDGRGITINGVCYTLSNNYGDVVINGNSSIYAKDGNSFAFDVYYQPSHGSGIYNGDHSVTVDTIGEIVGNIEIAHDSAAGYEGKDDTVSLVINKGTVKGNINVETTKPAGTVTIHGGSVEGKLKVATSEKNDVAIKCGYQ